jgi:hypothetical protein
MADGDFYKQEAGKIAETIDKLKQLDDDLEKALSRWEELEAKSLEVQKKQ